MANIKTLVGKNSLSVDTKSDSNIMPWHIFKKLFPGVTNVQLVKTINKHIMLKTFNKTNITQLGTCKVMIEQKKCQFFAVPANGKALLGKPDIDALHIININIDCIEAEDMGISEWNINASVTQEVNTKQETHGAVKCCANTDSISNSINNSTKSMVDTNKSKQNKPSKYFLLVPSYNTGKRKSTELKQQIHKEFNIVFNGIGCFEGTFSLQLKLDNRLYQAPPRHMAYVL